MGRIHKVPGLWAVCCGFVMDIEVGFGGVWCCDLDQMIAPGFERCGVDYKISLKELKLECQVSVESNFRLDLMWTENNRSVDENVLFYSALQRLEP